MVKEKDTDNVAEHELLNAQGESPDDLTDEDAVGYRYTLAGNKRAVSVMWDELSPTIQRAAGLFGIKTRFTNDTSGVRNKVKGKDADGKPIKPFALDFDGQIQAVLDTVEDWKRGVWIDRTREPGVPRVNKDALAQAICQVLVAQGKRTQADIDGGELAKTRARLDDDTKNANGHTYLTVVRTNGDVATAYNAIIGKPTASVDDLIA